MKDNSHPTREVLDPVCSMSLDIENVRHSHEHEGKEYYFCSEKCKTDFINDPDQYIEQISKN